MLAGEAQHRPAGDQRRQLGAGGQQLGDEGRGRQHVLGVVEHQQERPRSALVAQGLGERPAARLAHAEGARDRGGDEGRVADRGEGNEGGPVGEGTDEGLGGRQRHARLADAAGAGQRDEADVGAA